MCAVNLKLEHLDADLQDLNSQETKDEASLTKVRKQLRDIEAKAKDQEEELDEQAGTIQMLEQVGRRLISPLMPLGEWHEEILEGPLPGWTLALVMSQ